MKKNRELALARSRTHCLVWLTPQGFLSVFSPAELRRATLLLAQADARTHHQRAAVVFYLDQLSVVWRLQAFSEKKKDAPQPKHTLTPIPVAKGNLMCPCVFSSRSGPVTPRPRGSARVTLQPIRLFLALCPPLKSSRACEAKCCSLCFRWLIGIMWTDTSVSTRHGD